jgi:hypothetical protein
MDCLSAVAQYICDRHGKFPWTGSTIVLPGFVQTHHPDTGFHDAYYPDAPMLALAKIGRGIPPAIVLLAFDC